jgi:excisionase family DNA binding protein
MARACYVQIRMDSVALIANREQSFPGSHPEEEPPHMAEHENLDSPEALLTPSEVAALFRVNPKTVTRWARAGKLNAIRTLGGHRRFKASEIRACLEEMSQSEV